MKFGHEILNYKENILKDLEKLIAIPSVCSAPLPQKPFGAPCANALAFVLQRAEELGLETVNEDNYAGDARYGQGSEFADILTHVDVVPAAGHWDTPPFCMTEKNGFLYGRGSADNKGAAIAALYCLKALKDKGIKGRRTLRVIFGSGEEIASNDLDIYYSRQPNPVMAFTPDCDYGICNCEKGILRLDFIDNGPPPSCLTAFSAGVSVNSVPAEASACLKCSLTEHQKLITAASTLAAGLKEHFIFQRETETTVVIAKGCAAHGAFPEKGLNAASLLISLLKQVFSRSQLGNLTNFLAERIGMEYNGQSLGIAAMDSISGSLTLNLGLVNITPDCASASVDIRYPVTQKKVAIGQQLRLHCLDYSLCMAERMHSAPLYVPEDSSLIRLLKTAYSSVTGNPCNIYSTGGSTYARHVKGTAVAFGPTFPSDPSNNAHGSNERLKIDSFFLHAQICLEAMYLLINPLP